jgi:DNA-binding winged helix-turn-helix (wHTH) protein
LRKKRAMSASLLYFPPFRLDPSNERLWRETLEISLRPKTFAMLRYLVEHAEQLVTKEELLNAVWAETVVGEDALTGCIRELRKVFGEEAKQPRYIETVHRRGFRFIAPVTSAELPVSSAPALPLPDKPSLIVLPFVNMSHDPDQEYFSDGLTDVLTGDLSLLSSLFVIAQLRLHLQRQGGEDAERRARDGGALRAGRQRAEGRGAGADHGPVDRGRHRWAPVGGAL